MLFRDQIEAVINDNAGERLQFVAATYMPINDQHDIMHFYGIKKENGNISARVEYLGMSVDRLGIENDKVAFEKELSPGDFERLINDMAMKVAMERKGNRLIELTYKAKGITHPDADRLTPESKHKMFKLFLIIATGNKSSEAGYDAIYDTLNHVNNGNADSVYEDMLNRYLKQIN
ncbi:hypothetical protein ACK8P5_26200 (plasmid) [Paenibacillus sp. EC2-1]|uniref:hypothetical protein n=1 Tax=Paenibacillus sp. EC2-1 TaxID=3388665 RepID=UPI003BEF0CCD